VIDQVTQGFISHFGYSPKGVWSAPGRANLIGEHTDYNLGFVLPFGIDRRTYAAISLREDRICQVASDLDGKTYSFELGQKPTDLDWALYPLGVAHVLSTESSLGFDCFISSDVPVGAGLSSSAAIECAVAIALNELWQSGKTPQELALIGQRAENDVVGAPTGMMDQTASMLAQPDSAVLLDCKSLETKSVPLGLKSNNLVVAIIDTQVAHRHSDGGYRVRRESCERGADLMGVASLRELSIADLPKAEKVLNEVDFRRVRHIVTENQRVLDTVEALKSSDLKRLGELLAQSHHSMAYDFEISIPELDLAVSTAIESGAVGARMTGGGFGGAAIALIDKNRLAELEAACLEAFRAKNYQEPRVFVVEPSQGARKEL
jgi:galactokinase